MTKKDTEAVAAALNKRLTEFDKLSNEIADILQRAAPNFDRKKFFDQVYRIEG